MIPVLALNPSSFSSYIGVIIVRIAANHANENRKYNGKCPGHNKKFGHNERHMIPRYYE